MKGLMITAIAIGAVMIVLLVSVAVIQLKILKKKVYKQERTDSLTGIGNLRYFEESFARVTGELNYIAYIIIDSSYLQVYHGELTFNDAVKYVAGTLTDIKKDGEIVAKITENGFIYVFKQESEASAKEHIEELIRNMSVYLEGEEAPFFRISMYNLSADDKNSDLLLFNLRRYCGKLMGTNVIYEVCPRQMMNKELERKALLESISEGFKKREFKLYLQFVYESATGKINGAEALSRWETNDGAVIMPGKYIEIMEKSGIITRLDYYMLEQVCMQLHKWRATKFEDLYISCNVTRITLSEEDFVERVCEITKKYVFDKSKLVIEITEDAIERNIGVAINNILQCKKLGFRVALDDLGSGYTALSNLCDYPIDILKLDRSILLKADKEKGRDLLSGLVKLSHSLNFQVVCEGVETAEQRDFVAGTGCEYVQGWYYHKPDSVKNCEEFYNSSKTKK